MLHRSRVAIVHFAVTLVLLAVPAGAAWLPLTAGASVGAEPTVVVRDLAPGRVEVTVDVPGVDLERIDVAGQTMALVTVPGAAPMLRAGAPDLPLVARAVRLPARGEARLEVVAATWRTISSLPPAPSRGPLSRAVAPEDVPRRPGPMYAAAGVWPDAVAVLGRPFLVRDQRGASLRVHPVRWDAGRGRLLALAQLTLRIVTEGHGGVNCVERPIAAAPQAFGPLMTTLFGDDPAKGADDRGPIDDQGVGHGVSERMLVVTDAALRGAVDEFAAWKRECGLVVEVVDMDQLGGTVMGVMDAIGSRYFSPEGLAYVQLVGDVAQVPTLAGQYNGSDSDVSYGLLSGDDLYVDVLVSRFPARNGSEAAVMIDRSIAYERDVEAGAAWCTRAAGIASDEGDPADWERAEWLRDELLAAELTDVARIYQGFGGLRDDIATAVDTGVGLINYLGHGSGTGWLSVPFTSADVHALANTGAWPWIIDVSCSNGDFSADECFAESWLRATHDGAPTGAVAMLSASSPTSWVPPCVMQETMIDELTQSGESELGALHAAGVAAVLVMYEGLNQDRKLMEQYNLFGDASLQVRHRAPAPLAVAHDTWLPAGTAATAVTAPAGARVVLSSGDARLARAESTGDGPVLLVPARPLLEGETVRLTVTAADHRPYRVVLPVSTAPTASGDATPVAAALLGNWPNPFNPATTIAFEVPTTTPARVTVLDVRGRRIATLLDAAVNAGRHEVRWDGRDAGGREASAGVYLVRLDAVGTTWTSRMTLVK